MRKLVAGLVVGLAAAAVTLASNWAGERIAGGGVGLFQAIELRTYDWRLSLTARPETARQDIALVDIDEYSLRNLEPHIGRWPWPRAVHSLVIDYLARAPARLIVYDVNFAGADPRRVFDFGEGTWSGPESDKALSDSVRSAGNVLMLADATFDAAEASSTVEQVPDEGFAPGDGHFLERKIVFPPYSPLAGSAVGLGHNLFALDPDGPIRHVVPFVKTGDTFVPSLGVAAAIRGAGIDPAEVKVDPGAPDRLLIGTSVMPLSSRTIRTAEGTERYRWALIDFRGPATHADLKTRTYATYSFYDLQQAQEQLLQGQKPNIDPAIFKDKIVFVGTSAAGLDDVFETPFSRGNMSGMQVHAATTDDILSNRFMAPPAQAITFATMVIGSVTVGIIAASLPAWWAAAAMVVLGIVMTWGGTTLLASGTWLNLTLPAASSAIALTGGIGYQYFVEGREKRKMKKLFGQYVSKDVYAQLVANPDLARLGGQRREMTVLFSDMRGFTSITERAKPDEIVEMLNEYFTRMVAIVFRHHGTLDKFVGDMVMALFGAPLDDPDHADHAVAAALEMTEELRQLNESWRARGRFAELDIGVGINTGPMVAGNIGSEAIMSYTVIGDAVNLGSRLESLNKEYGTRIIISDATRQSLKRPYVVRPLGEVVVKGKTKPVAIFEVTGRAVDTPAARTSSEAAS